MPETAGGGRCPMDQADAQAIIGRVGGMEGPAGGERGVPRGRPAHEPGAGRPDGCGGSGRRYPEVLRLHGGAGSPWRAAGGHCSECNRVVEPVRPPFFSVRVGIWAGVSLGALATFSGVALWPVLGFILWRNCRAVCPDCGHGPMGGNVGWTRESLILWAGGFACFLAALWGTFHLALLLAWLFTQW